MTALVNPLDLSNRVILVTGASAGIGRAIAILLSELGARLIICGRNKDRLEQTARMLAAGDHLVESRDLNDLDSLPDWMLSIAGRCGPLSGLVHSAGITLTLPVRVQTVSQADAIMRTNWGAAWMLSKGFRQMGVRAATSSIVFISSVSGIVGQPGVSAYASSKGALLALTRVLALELAPDGIRVNAIAPGLVETQMAEELAKKKCTPEQFESLRRMFPLGLGKPLDIANATAFLLADTARWITGSTLTVDGGFTAH